MIDGTPSDLTMKRAALWYASNGFPVFPLHWPTKVGCSCKSQDCSDTGKHPRTLHGFKDATSEPAKVSEWWDKWPKANIGIPTGAASGLLVLDVDPRNGGVDSLESLIMKHGHFSGTAEQVTGGGGRHFFFSPFGGSLPKTLA